MTTTSEQAFDAMEWHDAMLLRVELDRSTPGDRDEVSLWIQWQDGSRQEVRFSDCYALEADMNFGVAAPESILAARCIGESPRLADIRRRWSALGVRLEDLRCFEITTNSTASQIRVYSKRFETRIVT